MTDIEIARSINPKDITEVAKTLGIENKIELYGSNKAKISLDLLDKKRNSKLVLVTAINPTPMGEGKTTVSISLNDALRKLGKKSILTLREPSLGPVFGVKGGATGGGYAQVIPMEDINLHFTGDFHAITTANNLLCSVIDNHIYQGNTLNIDKVIFKRCLDLNDRQLRVINTGLSKEKNTKERIDGFDITAASEIMAILCLSKDLNDLKRRLGNIVIGYDNKGKEITARMLKADGAMTVLLKDAIKPNLVQTLEGNPCIIHGGPFANIAHGCSSLIGTKTSLKLSDYTITEAGFGSDMGGIKFFDIKSKVGDIYPDIVVINVTIKALKYNGNDSLESGIKNLEYHIKNMQKFCDNVIVALNKFDDDLDEEIEFVNNFCKDFGVEFSVCEMYQKGIDGCITLAKKIVSMNENKKKYFVYDLEDTLEEKIFKMCKMFGASKVEYTSGAKEKLNKLNNTKMMICICKTPMSITDDKLNLGYPKDFKMTVTDIKVYNGARFIVVYMGNVLLMPGMPKNPNYLNMNINE